MIDWRLSAGANLQSCAGAGAGRDKGDTPSTPRPPQQSGINQVGLTRWDYVSPSQRANRPMC